MALAALVLSSCALFMPDVDENPRFVTVQGPHGPVNLHVEIEGRGRPVLLIHGLVGSTYTWRKVMPILARTNRVISIDLKGHGLSDKPQDKHYTVFDQARLVGQAIEQLRLDDLTVAGHSMGGIVTLAMMLEGAPTVKARISGIVLLSVTAHNQEQPFFFSLLEQDGLAELVVYGVPPELQSKLRYKINYPDGAPISLYDTLITAKPYYDPGFRPAMIETAKGLAELAKLDFSQQFRTVPGKKLLIWCEDDKVVPLSAGRRLQGDLAGSELVVLSQCGHSPMQIKPEETAAAIQRFMRQ